MSRFLADKMTAVSSKLRELANETGYGQFVTGEKLQAWSHAIVSTISDVEMKYGFTPLHTMQPDEKSQAAASGGGHLEEDDDE